MLSETYFDLKVPWNFLQSSIELFEQHPWFHGIPWNLSNKTSSSMEFYGIPWNFVQIQSSMEFRGTFSILPSSMEFHGTFKFPQKSSMEFHGTFLKFHGIPWNLINFIFKKIIFLNIVFGIWLMIRCYLAKISQKRYTLHWFQYRNSYFEHPSVSENGARSAKMACCLRLKLLIMPKLLQFNTCYQTAFRRVVWTHFAKVAETFGRIFWKRQRKFSKCLFKEVKVFKMQLIWGFKTS